MEEFYKEYRYKRTGNALRVYVPQRHRCKIEELKALRNSLWVRTKVGFEDCIVSLVPIQMFLEGCTNLTKVQFRVWNFEEDTTLAYTKNESTQIIDEIDLLLNPEGFYE